ncbi:hypothetical protein H6P81_012214 [Aristolochia fimbriata]|uniref:Uncharacterized protein n=1 Tax=Aristolochia fimbriata TaxID=158543 RepID=A0AAV7EE94_ARIFI|nr:hypothetical protein H6P81_012214 [Aristolochia fimbriata]
MRSKGQRELLLKEKDRKEQELRALAQKARSERTGVAPNAIPLPAERGMANTDEMQGDHERVRERDMSKETEEERDERLQREKIREERRRERERERGLETRDAAIGKKSKITTDRDRDVSEKVVLGKASTGGGLERSCMIRDYLTRRKADDHLYKPKKDADTEMYGGADEQLEKVLKTDRFKPDKGFAGAAERTGPRDRPVDFEKEVEEPDPFCLDQFLTEAKKGKKAMDKIGSGGTLKASAGSSMRDGHGGSGRTRIGFERAQDKKSFSSILAVSKSSR